MNWVIFAGKRYDLDPDNSIVLHSMAERARETAEIIAQILGLKSEETMYLGDQRGTLY